MTVALLGSTTTAFSGQLCEVGGLPCPAGQTCVLSDEYGGICMPDVPDKSTPEDFEDDPNPNPGVCPRHGCDE